MVKLDSFLCEQVLVSLRRIIRAVDLHSHKLTRQEGVTTPQVLILQALNDVGESTAGELARQVSLGQATLTGILDRLEKRGWLERSRTAADKRVVLVRLTEAGRSALEKAPSPLQGRFMEAFVQLPDWEQSQILASLQKLAALMETEDEAQKGRTSSRRVSLPSGDKPNPRPNVS